MPKATGPGSPSPSDSKEGRRRVSPGGGDPPFPGQSIFDRPRANLNIGRLRACGESPDSRVRAMDRRGNAWSCFCVGFRLWPDLPDFPPVRCLPARFPDPKKIRGPGSGTSLRPTGQIPVLIRSRMGWDRPRSSHRERSAKKSGNGRIGDRNRPEEGIALPLCGTRAGATRRREWHWEP